jgi:sugar/nucleoside kinase (ribokinase family)
MPRRIDAVVAGHICLDIVPTFGPGAGAGGLRPGALYKVGPALRNAGGAVANTGLALHHLGVAVALMGKVGDDPFGHDIQSMIHAESEHLLAGMKVSPGQTTSYTVVISPPGVDRTLLHCPGCNDTFTFADLNEAVLQGARLFHFGYPPLMRSMYQDGGTELVAMFQRVKAMGLGTSLDMADPDAASEAGKVDWLSLLTRVLPHVDVFVPSIGELLYMLDRPTWDRLMQKGRIDVAADVTRTMLRELAGRLISMGTAVVMIKLGDQGAYMLVSNDIERIRKMGRCCPYDILAWIGQEVAEPCFKARAVADTTGSGDCTIAGLLAAVLRGIAPQESLPFAVAVGACSVEEADAVSGVPHLLDVEQRIAAGWERLPSVIAPLPGAAPSPSSDKPVARPRTPNEVA